MNKKKLFIILSVVVALIITGIIITIIVINNKEDDDSSFNSNNYYNEQNEKTDKTEKEVKKELTESEKLNLKLSSLVSEKLVFDAGDYVQGDIPAGEYAFIKFDDSGSYYEEDDAAGNIIDNENFSSFGYVKVHASGDLTTRGILVNVTAFEKLEVSGAKQIYEVLNEKENWNQSGFYKVGKDIEPGKYIIESMGTAYYAKLSGPVSSNRIIDNDNFNGKKTVTVKSGQYLEVNRASIIKAE